MNLSSCVVQIMWKDIFIILGVVFGINLLIGIYMLFACKRIFNDFYSGNIKGLKNRAIKLRRLYNFYSAVPYSKNMCLIYNHLCLLISSMALLEGEETEFLKQLSVVKQAINYEWKPFVLALYYRSKNDIEIATKYYQKYLNCNHKDDNIKIILDGLFVNQEYSGSDASFLKVKRSFKNPAIIKLLKDNGLSVIDEV